MGAQTGDNNRRGSEVVVATEPPRIKSGLNIRELEAMLRQAYAAGATGDEKIEIEPSDWGGIRRARVRIQHYGMFAAGDAQPSLLFVLGDRHGVSWTVQDDGYWLSNPINGHRLRRHWVELLRTYGPVRALTWLGPPDTSQP